MYITHTSVGRRDVSQNMFFLRSYNNKTMFVLIYEEAGGPDATSNTIYRLRLCTCKFAVISCM